MAYTGTRTQRTDTYRQEDYERELAAIARMQGAGTLAWSRLLGMISIGNRNIAQTVAASDWMRRIWSTVNGTAQPDESVAIPDDFPRREQPDIHELGADPIDYLM